MNILKVMDATGAGDVMFEELQMTCHNLIGFVFTEPSKLKMMTELVKDVQRGDVKFIEPVADEMYVFQYARTPSGHYRCTGFWKQYVFHPVHQQPNEYYSEQSSWLWSKG